MEDVFQTRAKTDFLELFEIFIENLVKLWPDCADSMDLKILFTGVVKHTPKEQDYLITSWFENTTAPLTKKVKYYKALERILQGPGLFFHACEYRDIDSMELSNVSDNLKKISIFDKYRDGTMAETDKVIFWKYISELNHLCFKAMDKSLPRVPSRDEIRSNIKNKSIVPSQDNSPSMKKAFQNAFATLCQDIKIENLLLDKNEEEMQVFMSKWASFAQHGTEEGKVAVLCNQKNHAAIAHLNTVFPEIPLEAVNMNDKLWNLIVQLNGYSAVGENIPSGMMGKIENIANRLADDIVNGRADMSNMNLSNIGQEVLSQCDEGEMNKFASNIDNLLPALQSFQKGGM